MFEEFSNQLKAHLYDRVNSSYFGAFAVAWVIWNVNFLVVVFGDQKSSDKLLYLEKHFYGDFNASLMNLVVHPALSAACFVIVLPIVDGVAFSYMHSIKAVTKFIKAWIDKETILTERAKHKVFDDALRIRKSAEENASKVAEENLKLSSEIIELESNRQENRRLYDLASARIESLESDLESAIQNTAEANQRATDNRIELEQSKQDKMKLTNEIATRESALKALLENYSNNHRVISGIRCFLDSPDFADFLSEANNVTIAEVNNKLNSLVGQFMDFFALENMEDPEDCFDKIIKVYDYSEAVIRHAERIIKDRGGINVEFLDIRYIYGCVEYKYSPGNEYGFQGKFKIPNLFTTPSITIGNVALALAGDIYDNFRQSHA